MDFQPSTAIPSLRDKVILVTGGNEGLGKETVLQLALHAPAKIYLAARNVTKAEAALAEIQQKAGDNCAPIQILQLDLSSFDSVRKAAEEVKTNETRLDILIANAGVMGSKGVTDSGYEMQFGVNHMGHAFLICCLLPLLQHSAKLDAVVPGETRCVIVASDAEKLAPRSIYPFEKLKGSFDSGGMLAKYGISKLANLHYTSQLAKHYPEQESGIRFVAIHPGGVTTNLGGDVLKSWPTVQKVIRKLAGALIRLVPVEDGVRNQLWAATWPVGKSEGPGEAESGTYYHPIAVKGQGSHRAYDEAKASELWEWTQKELQPHLTT